MRKRKNLAKLYLLVITLPKGKHEVIGDLLEKYDVTAYLNTLARGSTEKIFTKEMMFCVIKEERLKEAMLAIQDKYSKFHKKISMVYSVPLENIIGVSSYMALSNGGIK